MGLISALIGFAIHAAAVLIGARLAKMSRIDFWKAAVVALLSYIVIVIPMFLLGWIPLFGLIIIGLGTAVTVKLIWDTEWRNAYMIGAVVVVAYIIVGILPLPFGLF